MTESIDDLIDIRHYIQVEAGHINTMWESYCKDWIPCTRNDYIRSVYIPNGHAKMFERLYKCIYCKKV